MGRHAGACDLTCSHSAGADQVTPDERLPDWTSGTDSSRDRKGRFIMSRLIVHPTSGTKERSEPVTRVVEIKRRDKAST